ncbi:Malate dehydrogenase, cytoplasmic [Hypoxylon texense]
MSSTVEDGEASHEDGTSECNFSDGLESLFGKPTESTGGNEFEEPSAIPTISDTTPPHQDDPSYGLQWTSNEDPFSSTPRWTTEPTVGSIILTLKKAVNPHKEYIVDHCWNGVYNKIYSVSYDQKRCIMRVSLPVCPQLKTESEAATLRWICDNTNLPVPRVHCYDSSRNNPIGFEWILMDRMEGIPLSECWDSITQDCKKRIVRQIAAYAAVAFERQFRGIGNIHPSEPNDTSASPRLGEMVSMALF